MGGDRNRARTFGGSSPIECAKTCAGFCCCCPAHVPDSRAYSCEIFPFRFPAHAPFAFHNVRRTGVDISLAPLIVTHSHIYIYTHISIYICIHMNLYSINPYLMLLIAIALRYRMQGKSVLTSIN